MTFEKFAHDYLYNNGLFGNEVDQVIELAKADDVLKDTMANRWQDNMEGYPPEFKSVFILSLKRVALQWIDANKPHAWYRPVFAS